MARSFLPPTLFCFSRALTLLLCASQAHALSPQGTVHIHIEGVVVTADSTITGAFAGAGIGDDWQLDFDARLFGSGTSSGQRFYSIVAASRALTSTGGAESFPPEGPTLTMIRQANSAQYGTSLLLGSGNRMRIAASDSTAPYIFPTNDLSQLEGTYAGAEFQFTIANVTSTALRLQVDTIVVGPPVGNDIGIRYCQAVPSSTGFEAELIAVGSTVAASNDVTLAATLMPAGSFGFFLVSSDRGFTANPGGSAGNLCLAGSIGRYVRPGEVRQADATGRFELRIDLMGIPTPTGSVAATAGARFAFQAWFRDTDPQGVPTSNFTRGLELQFD